MTDETEAEAAERVARRRAEACFAVARSATVAGERAAAINRGAAIADKAGLSLDDFDVPGRAPKPPPSRFTNDLFERSRAPNYASMMPDELLREFNDLFRRGADAYRAPDPADVRAERSRRAAQACGPCRGSGFASGRVNHGTLCQFCSGQGTILAR